MKITTDLENTNDRENTADRADRRNKCAPHARAALATHGDRLAPAMDAPIRVHAGCDAMSSGYVFSPDDILPTREELVERAVTKVLAVADGGPAAETMETGNVHLDGLDGRLVAACDVPDGHWSTCQYEMVRAGGYFIVRETLHDMSSMAACDFDLFRLVTRLHLVPSTQGEALLAVESLVRNEVFERIVRDGGGRRNWLGLALRVTSSSAGGSAALAGMKQERSFQEGALEEHE